MSKKKVQTLVERSFDKKADILTMDGSKYYIRKVRLYNVETGYYGKACVITSSKYNKKNLHIIKEFYDTNQTDRIHVRLCRLTNVKMTKSIEKTPDGKERKILIIDGYDNEEEFVHSVGPIKVCISDKNKDLNKNHTHIISLPGIKKLRLENEEGNNKKAA